MPLLTEAITLIMHALSSPKIWESPWIAYYRTRTGVAQGVCWQLTQKVIFIPVHALRSTLSAARRLGLSATSTMALNKLRPFLVLDRCTQSTQECIDCEVAEGCAWCQGENYDAADTPTIYQRSTAICKMHKARVRANNYYWNKLFRKLEMEGNEKRYAKSDNVIC